ncbi:hypothetical protein JMJ77_0007302 [Colletotrichum scovillei]|uniref:Uncharacterized protein n=1 Tax=Colletotrichum scovillei TaxID=1209932 RepID=A0A9P7RCJ3_9PEZI|nr:hypothetical protein JMJ77_0007302 [Colletotrichum scovillei]KAG7074235.1 hypothetical protein JMJ76_0010719 [Colletotrichum scovillei]KAG7081234.1 hypothetical protein JMJ78_0003360 [Colletotrichum scovillei]
MTPKPAFFLADLGDPKKVRQRMLPSVDEVTLFGMHSSKSPKPRCATAYTTPIVSNRSSWT